MAGKVDDSVLSLLWPDKQAASAPMVQKQENQKEKDQFRVGLQPLAQLRQQ